MTLKQIKLVENYIRGIVRKTLNEDDDRTSLKAPTRIKSQSAIKDNFWGKDLVDAEALWGKNTSRVLQHLNKKYYQVTYKFSNGSGYLELRPMKDNGNGTFSIK